MIPATMRIGVTHTGTDEKHTNYINWLKGQDTIELIALSPQHTGIDSVIGFDGIVLSGGIDMHPKYYNSNSLHYPNAPDIFHEERDEFEIKVFEMSQRHHIPVLGVCRGMQLVNCALGGTMVQDIGEGANLVHRFEDNDKAHGINLVPGSLLNQVAGVERSVSNSAHHQAIDRLGNGLIINCRSDDGIIEGLEWEDKDGKAFFLGVQWHPERMYKLNLAQSPLSKSIRDHFIHVVKNSIKHQHDHH